MAGPARDGFGRPRRRGRIDRLPSGRSLLGAALVVVAASGVLAAHRAASRPPSTRYVVAAKDLRAGVTVRDRDLGTLSMDLPTGVPAYAASDARSLVGTVTRHPLSALDLVRPGDLVEPSKSPLSGSVEVPVEVDRSRSLGSSVHTGSRVDVLSTDPDGVGTTVLAHGALVVAVEDRGSSIGSSGGVRFRLAVPDAATATEVVDASVRARLTLVLPDAGATRG